MMLKERQEAIKHYIEKKGNVTLDELGEKFSDWSEMTLRRDLEFLEQRHFLIRTKGGARIMPSMYEITTGLSDERMEENLEQKKEIAEKAAALITSDIGLFIDAGSTGMEFARRIPDRNLIVVTAAPNIGMEVVMKKENVNLILLGGALSRRTMATYGPSAMEQLRNMNIDTAFMSTTGYTESTGFSISNHNACTVKQAVVSTARRVVMLMDSSKINSVMPYTFARLSDIDIIITDSQMPESVKEDLRQAGVQVL